MLFKLFQLFLRWFPMLHRFVQKRRYKNSIINRHVFNKAFCTVVRDPNMQGSLESPIYVKKFSTSYFGGETRIDILPSAKVINSVLSWPKEIEVLTGEVLTGVNTSHHQEFIKDLHVEHMKKYVGKVFLFRQGNTKYLLLGVMKSSKTISHHKMVLTFLEVPSNESLLFDIEIPTIQWETGAIRKKDLPITHMLREKEAVRMCKEIAKKARQRVDK